MDKRSASRRLTPAAEAVTKRESRAAGLEKDRLRVAVLKSLPADSLERLQFERDLLRIGVGSLMSLSKKNELRSSVLRVTRISLPEPPDSWGVDEIRSIVAEAVNRTVGPFMESAVDGGGWDFAKGARLVTFFVNRCYFTFADDYRAELKSWKTTRRQLSSAGDAMDPDVLHHVQLIARNADPAQTALSRQEIREILADATHQHIPAIVFYKAQKMTSREIAEIIGDGMTENAVNSAMSDFRTAVLNREA